MIQAGGGGGRQYFILRNQIDVGLDLIDKWLVVVAWDPKSTYKEFAASAVIYDLVGVAQVDQETGIFVGFFEIRCNRSAKLLRNDGESDDGVSMKYTTQVIGNMSLMR